MSLRKFCMVSFIGLLAACSTGAVREEVEQRAQMIDQDLDRAREPLPPYRSNPLVVTDRIWTGSKAMRLHHGVPLPAKFETRRGFSLVSATPMDLEEIANVLSGEIGISRAAWAGGAIG